MDKQKYLEQLSALMDEELNEKDRDNLFNLLKKDPELFSTWERYHAIQSLIQEENLFKEDFKKALRQKIVNKKVAPPKKIKEGFLKLQSKNSEKENSKKEKLKNEKTS